MAVIGTSNINVQDIGNVLNDAGGSVNINQPLTFFTESAKINKWAKYKPVPLKANFAQNFNSSAPDYDADWWKGDDGNCGLRVDKLSGEGTYRESVSESAKYKYILPTGGEYAPYRLSDFIRYNTEAINPATITFPSSFKISNETSYLNFFLDLSNTAVDFDSTTMLSLTDIGIGQSELSTKYFCIAIRKATSSIVRFFQSEYTVGEAIVEESSLQIRLSLKDDNLNSANTDLGFSVSNGDTVEVYAFLGTELSNKTAINIGYRSIYEPSMWLSLYTEDTPPYKELVVQSGYSIVEVSSSFKGTESYNISMYNDGEYGHFRLETIKIALSYISSGQSDSTPISYRIRVVAVDNDDNYLIDYSDVVDRVLSQSPSQGVVTWNLTDANDIEFSLSNEDALYYTDRYRMTIRLTPTTVNTGITGSITSDIVWNGSYWVLENFNVN